MKRLVLATGNPGKVRELNALLSGLGIEVLPQSDFDVPEIAETGLTFVENALLKARNAARYSGLPAIADDSGLEVDVLRGAPGIYSARYAGPQASDQDNVFKLLDALREIPDGERSARFQCVLVFMRQEDDPTPLICQGAWEGQITREPAGSSGFGYDPIFFVPGLGKTAAELEPALKNQQSHRGQALALLVGALASRSISTPPEQV
ncbi:MAG: RdgB/HAM1 family non-canonical purine NTP pyrophosphatase [Gammaproteobacteria bacterium]|nr:RdgB/HAM1 family non-canonical purine NTP pyrophosphatase [Gammaproteobacteria bacterium]MCP5424654.1 RdgB/HAM1 family non-canonical purine NTP pyrophosphatase [Gammaproteobacteria bacterium]